jgi:hypothetical protein
MDKTLLRKLMRELGASGGKKAAARMTPKQRSERAKKASEARWNKESKQKGGQ